MSDLLQSFIAGIASLPSYGVGALLVLIERGGPYRFVRHPGYLGSPLCLNGVALASGNTLTLSASITATFAPYAYRIRVEDAMLVAAFGAPYESYRRETGALLPSFRGHGESV